MVDGRSPGKIAPPYLGYRTLQNFVSNLRQGIPQRLDRSVMRTLGGTVQKQLIHALRYLGLTDEFDVPQAALKRLVAAEGDERQRILQGILAVAYPFLCGESTQGFELASATPRQLTEKFQALGIQGDTVRKAESFFLQAASDAGMAISPHILKRRPQGGTGQLSRPRNGQKARRRNNPEEFPTPRATSPVGTDGEGISKPPSTGQGAFAWEELSSALRPLGAGYLSLEGLLRQLPMSRQWTEQHRDQWFKAFTATLDLMIEVVETRNDHPQNTEKDTDRINSS